MFDSAAKRSIAIQRTHNWSIADLAEEHNCAYSTMAALIREDPEMASLLEEERGRAHNIVVRETYAFMLHTGQYRATLEEIAREGARDADRIAAAKTCLAYAIGQPVQRNHNIDESRVEHSIHPEQFERFLVAVESANSKKVVDVDTEPEAHLVHGKEALPTASDIAQQSVEGQLGDA